MTWWDDYNDGVRRLRETGWGADASMLSREICELLDDVDTAFAVTGADTPGWQDPHGDGTAPDEAEYERLTNPEKFLIVVSRARAWSRVLLDRGWAREASQVDWALRPFDSGGTDTVLSPAADGAVPLVLTTHTPVDSDHIFTVTVAAGDPAVTLASIPDCGCDACDRGSAPLLEEMDRWVLSVVDGSLQVDVATDRSSVRTSFGGHGGTVQHLDQPTAFTAAPWPTNWTARPIPPEVETRHPESAFPRTVIGSSASAVRLLLRDGPAGSAQRYRSL
ncbi:DUF6226 family protein [Prescottella agglutinans]|uniref:DUF6226 family protein n=1 Tax=Prescottella agglutinans TaxID=1644129 RepID=UPI003D98817E